MCVRIAVSSFYFKKIDFSPLTVILIFLYYEVVFYFTEKILTDTENF